MKKWRKYLAAVLAAVMMTGSAVPVAAEEFTEPETAIAEITEEAVDSEVTMIPEETVVDELEASEASLLPDFEPYPNVEDLEDLDASTGYLRTIAFQGTFDQTSAREVAEKLNRYRTSGGAWCRNQFEMKVSLGPMSALRYDYGLEMIAMQRAAELVAYFDHVRPFGEYWYTCEYEDDRGYAYSWAENIAAGYSSSTSVYNAWLEENEDYAGQGHRRNMLSTDYQAIGVACFIYNGVRYWVQEFGEISPCVKQPMQKDGPCTVAVTYDSVLEDLRLGSMDTSDRTVYVGSTTSLPKGPSYEVTVGDIHEKGNTVLEWSSGDPSIAQVEDTKVKALKAGTTVLNGALDEETSYQVRLIVKDLAAAPVLDSAVNQKNGIKVTWKPSSETSTYRLYRKVPGGSWAKVADTSATSYTDTTAENGVDYVYTVAGLTSDGKNKCTKYDTAGLSVRRLACVTPTLANVADGVKVSWTKVNAATGYYVYKKVNNSWKAIKKITDNSTTSYVDTEAVTSGTIYTFSIRPYYIDSKCMAYVNGKDIMRLDTVAATMTNTADGIKVAWTKVPGAAGYYVYKKINGSYSRIATINSGSTVSYVDKSTMTNGTAYGYAVKAFNGSYYGAYVGKSIYRLTPVSITKMYGMNTKGQATVNWSTNPKAHGYQVQYSPTSDFKSGNKSFYIEGGSVGTYKLSGMTKGTTYYVRVRAYKTNSAGTRYFSAWSSKVTTK